jgi:uncharacterized protein with NAD-binding domain and iron-sulfur cluster
MEILQHLTRLIIRILPDFIVEEINDRSLKELDRRGLIIWADEINQNNPSVENASQTTR